jgi:hypothetical protein
MEKSYGRNLVAAIGGDLRPFENRKAWLTRVAKLVGKSYRVVSGAFYREPLSKDTEQALQRAAAEKKKNEDHARIEDLERWTSEWETIDPILYQHHIRTFRRAASLMREMAHARRHVVVDAIPGDDSPDEEQGAA